MAWYKIMEGDKQLGSHMCSESANIAIKGMREGTFWAYRGDTKKRTVSKIKMKQSEM